VSLFCPLFSLCSTFPHLLVSDPGSGPAGGRGCTQTRQTPLTLTLTHTRKQINPFFGAKGHNSGAEQLIDWLDWAVVTHKINVANKTEELDGADGPEAHVTRVFTPQTFRALLKHGSNV
jgi:hypothetical protein